MNGQFGLVQRNIDAINEVFHLFPSIQKVILYGSRAKGNYREGSDIDLTIFGEEMDIQQLLKIKNKLDDLMLPYKFDISLFHHITEPDLIDHINRVGKVFYSVKQS